jgi:hypothetical protein
LLLNCLGSSASRALPRPVSRRTFPRTWRRLCRESTTLEHRHRNRSRDYSLCDCPAIFREPPAAFTADSRRPDSESPSTSISFPIFPLQPVCSHFSCALVTGGRGRIRTSVARKERQIYSLLVLATHPPVLENSCGTTARSPNLYTQSFILRAAQNTKRTRVQRHQPVVFVVRIPLRLTPLQISWWSWRRELNPRPSDYKSDALPAELRQRCQTWR